MKIDDEGYALYGKGASTGDIELLVGSLAIRGHIDFIYKDCGREPPQVWYYSKTLRKVIIWDFEAPDRFESRQHLEAWINSTQESIDNERAKIHVHI